MFFLHFQCSYSPLGGNVLLKMLFFFISVSNLALVKPDKAKAVENYLIQMARFGQLGGKVRKKLLHLCLFVFICM